MKIVFFEAEKWECDILQQACCNHEVVFTDEELGR
jgi:D-lactate dehydrogenase